MAGQVAVPGNGIDSILGIANLLGGQKTTGTTTTTGDTAALQDVLAQLKGLDPTAQLATIFQQAAGSIPGLQTGLGNALGARSGGNSAVAAALQKLLQQTTLAGQQQVSQQQLQNLQLQGNAGAAIANTNKTTKTNQQQGTNLQQLGSILGIMQLASKTGLTKKIGDLFNSGGGDLATGAVGNLGVSDAVGGFGVGDVAPGMDIGNLGIGGPAFDVGGLFDNLGSSFTADLGGGLATDLGTSVGTDLGAGFGFNLDDAWGGVIDSGGGDIFGGLFGGWKDGGLVGRDKPAKPSTAKGVSDKKVKGYADGGIVLPEATLGAGGSRRSANPTFNPLMPKANSVGNVMSLFAPRPTGPGRAPTLFQEPEDMGGVAGASASAPDSPTAQSVAVGNAVGGLVSNAVVGMVGIPGLSTALSALGITPSTLSALSALANVAVGTDNTDISFSLDPEAPQMSLDAMAAQALAESSAVNPDAVNMSGDPAGDGTGAAASGAGADGPGGDGSGGVGVGDGGTGWKSGGHVNGPGSGTSDSIPAKLSDGEYVVPADVVQQPGVLQFLDMMRSMYHQPMQKPQGAK